MGKRRKILTKEEIEKIAQYQWASVKDIMDIGAIGRNKAREVLNIISNKFYDNKYVSIPFEDICLNEKEISSNGKVKIRKTTEGLQEIGMKPGDVFTWKENGTDWLVYLRRLEETAYFRAEIRRCRYTVTIDDTEYKCYVARPSTNEID